MFTSRRVIPASAAISSGSHGPTPATPARVPFPVEAEGAPCLVVHASEGVVVGAKAAPGWSSSDASRYPTVPARAISNTTMSAPSAQTTGERRASCGGSPYEACPHPSLPQPGPLGGPLMVTTSDGVG